MKQCRLLELVLFAALVLAAGPDLNAQQEREPARQTPRGEQAPKPPAEGEASPIYKPPLRGAPGGRVGGGTRGTDREMFVLSILAPDHTGLTISERPSLYWFISSKALSPVEMTLVDPRMTKPVIEFRLPGPVAPGVHAIRLADHGVKLELGVAYRWYIAVVPDPGRRSKDLLTGGAIERIEPAEELRARLARASTAALPSIYAEAGLWYDALAAISGLIDARPDDPGLRRQRAAMLEQVGLPKVD